jgi:hypothetical protein
VPRKHERVHPVSDNLRSGGGGLDQAASLYQERCTEANARLYAAVRMAQNTQELEAAYAEHTASRNAALKAYTDARSRILG